MKVFKYVGLENLTELVQYSDLSGIEYTAKTPCYLMHKPVSEKHINSHCNSFESIKNEHVQPLIQALDKLNEEKNCPEQVFVIVTGQDWLSCLMKIMVAVFRYNTRMGIRNYPALNWFTIMIWTNWMLRLTTYADFEFGFIPKKINSISSLVDRLRSYLRAIQCKSKIVKQNTKATSYTDRKKNESKKRKITAVISDDEEEVEGEHEIMMVDKIKQEPEVTREFVLAHMDFFQPFV